MLLTSNSGFVFWTSQQKSERTTFFILSLVNCDPSLLFLSDRCRTCFDSRFDILYVVRCSSVYLRYEMWLLVLLLPFYQLEQVRPFSSNFFHQKGISIHRIATRWFFFFVFWPFFVNPRNGCSLKILRDQTLMAMSISKTLKLPFLSILMHEKKFSSLT